MKNTFFLLCTLLCLLAVLAACNLLNPATQGKGALETPKNVTASRAYTDRIEIVWTASQGATYYVVYCSQTGVGDYTELAGNIRTTSYSYTPVEAGKYYWFKVAAIGESGSRSTFSTSAKGWIILQAPTEVIATQGTPSSGITISWNPVQNAVSYSVYLEETPAALFSTPFQTGIIETSVTLTTEIQQGVHYWLKIVAVDILGYEGVASTVVEGWVDSLIDTVIFEDDCNGFLQVYTNDPDLYECYFAINFDPEITLGTYTSYDIKLLSGSKQGFLGAIMIFQDWNNFLLYIYRIEDSAFGLYYLLNGTWYLLDSGTLETVTFYNDYNVINTITCAFSPVQYEGTIYYYHSFYMNDSLITYLNYTSNPSHAAQSGLYVQVATPETGENFPAIPLDVRMRMTYPSSIPDTQVGQNLYSLQGGRLLVTDGMKAQLEERLQYRPPVPLSRDEIPLKFPEVASPLRSF